MMRKKTWLCFIGALCGVLLLATACEGSATPPVTSSNKISPTGIAWIWG